jgi:dihydroorotate dehydrogenase electron transfer subunit
MFDQTLKIIFNDKISSDTFLLGLRSPEIAAESMPGQFVMIRIDNTIDPLLRRPFSVCGIRDKKTILILYRVLGKGTSILSQKQEGELVSVMGPLGNGFKLPDEEDKALLIAGGMGVAPLFFLAGRLNSFHIEFMAGFKTSDEIIRPERLDDLSINISIATDDGSSDYKGFVTDLLEEYIDCHRESSDSLRVYSCGPISMLKKTAAITAKNNIPCQVSLETHMACGLGVCQGCAVKVSGSESRSPYRYACQDGPVFSSCDIDWNSL